MRYRFGPFQLDTLTAQLRGPDGDIALRPMSLRLLQVLIENAPNLQTHEQLLDAVWGRQAVSVGVVAQSVRELRRALGESVQAPAYIETRHRLGYRFIAEVQRCSTPDEAPQGVRSPAAPPSETSAAATVPPAAAGRAAPAARRRWLLPAAAVFACLAVVAVGLVWRGGAPDPSGRYDEVSAQEILSDGRPQEPDAAALYLQALRALRDGNLHAARDGFEAVLAREPGSAAAMAALAETLALAGDMTQARQWGAAAQRASGALPRVERLRLDGFVAGIDDRWADAVRPLQAVFELRPGDVDTGFRLFDAQLAAGRPADALATLDALIALDAPHVDAHRLALAQARAAVLRGDHRARLAAGVRAEQAARKPRGQIEALLEQSAAHLLLGERDAAGAALVKADALSAEDDWPAGAMRIAMAAGTLARDAGDHATALQRFADAGAAADALGQRAVAMAARREAAFVLYLAGRLPEARDALRPLLDDLAALGNRRELASTLDVAALVEQRAGDMDAARTLAERALATYIEAGDRAGEAAARSNLGMLFARAGRFTDAEPQMERALALFRTHGDRRGVATTQGNLAAVYARTGRSDAAREANEAALVDFRALGATLDVARLQFNLGLQDRRAGRLADTETRFREALDGFTAVGAADMRLQVIASLAELLLQRADLVAAQALLDEAGDLGSAPPQRQAAIETARARLALLRNALESAQTAFANARGLRDAAGLPDWVLASDLDLAELAARRGDLVQAERDALRVRRALGERGDITATQAGLVVAGIRAAQGDAIGPLLDEIEAELAAASDAALRLRLDLTRATGRGARREDALLAVANDARALGFELIALRAELLVGGPAAEQAALALAERGVGLDGLPPGLPF
ncbi:tetratricopeptide repeat protein [Chiayiivirga flava]|uniref:DNA-binding winged helix-turn-helix (WHTH) protein/tetratricopeptide (TPR) repeat protein n=1 Tax=Chiayiivirga flava TaxID=659595 RepID=A0A7W8D7F0_9GAMM|nr:tetratricopeptide repeat protein [Chiayiivirga flava]MBB5209336.1 DNA-binding winged helix-turn-helix (wHTH) protein/tetratricopeptide (TPR) repeat protein [Chiayiivirga flava]